MKFGDSFGTVILQQFGRWCRRRKKSWWCFGGEGEADNEEKNERVLERFK